MSDILPDFSRRTLIVGTAMGAAAIAARAGAQTPPNDALRHRNLVGVLRQRPCAGDGRVSRTRGEVLGHPLSRQHLLHVLEPPRNGRDAAKNDACAPAGVTVHLRHHGGGHHGMGPRFAVRHLEVVAAGAGLRRGQVDRRNHFVLGQHVLGRGILARQHEEVRRRHLPLSGRADDAEEIGRAHV